MKTLAYLLTLLSLIGMTMASAPKAQAITMQATLIEASNQAAQPDPHLKDYTPNLQRIFRYNSYRMISRNTTKCDVPGAGAISVAGHHIKFNTQPADGNRVRLAIDWVQGKKLLMKTTVTANRAQPTVLGGPSTDNGKLILVLEYE